MQSVFAFSCAEIDRQSLHSLPVVCLEYFKNGDLEYS